MDDTETFDWGASKACAICWKTGHFARDCTGPPHAQSNHRKAIQHREGKTVLWAGRTKEAAPSAMAVDLGADSEEMDESGDLEKFALSNPGAFLSFCKGEKPRRKKRKVKAEKLHSSMAGYVEHAVLLLAARGQAFAFGMHCVGVPSRVRVRDVTERH